MPAQLDGHKVRHGDRAHLLGLGCGQHQLAPVPLHLSVDRQPAPVELEPVRRHPEHRAHPQTGEAERYRRPERCRRCCQDRQRLGSGRDVVGPDLPGPLPRPGAFRPQPGSRVVADAPGRVRGPQDHPRIGHRELDRRRRVPLGELGPQLLERELVNAGERCGTDGWAQAGPDTRPRVPCPAFHVSCAAAHSWAKSSNVCRPSEASMYVPRFFADVTSARCAFASTSRSNTRLRGLRSGVRQRTRQRGFPVTGCGVHSWMPGGSLAISHPPRRQSGPASSPRR
jgi:hypothetical protein